MIPLLCIKHSRFYYSKVRQFLLTVRLHIFEQMQNNTLFAADPNENLLPYDGKVYYYGPIYQKQEADFLFTDLLENIKWKKDEAIMFGKRIQTKRMIAWYAQQPFSYRYSGVTKTAYSWNADLEKIKTKVQEMAPYSYNSCLLNLYHDGKEGMAYHSDGEKDLKENAAIAALSLGAERKFSFKHKESKERIDILLEHGSLLIMVGETQKHWLHRLPPTVKVHEPRISLTFRTIENTK